MSYESVFIGLKKSALKAFLPLAMKEEAEFEREYMARNAELGYELHEPRSKKRIVADAKLRAERKLALLMDAHANGEADSTGFDREIFAQRVVVNATNPLRGKLLIRNCDLTIEDPKYFTLRQGSMIEGCKVYLPHGTNFHDCMRSAGYRANGQTTMIVSNIFKYNGGSKQ